MQQIELELLEQTRKLTQRITTQDTLLNYYRADNYSIRRRNHFLVIANRIYVITAILLIVLGVVWLLFM